MLRASGINFQHIATLLEAFLFHLVNQDIAFMRTLVESISGIRGIFGAGLDAQVLVRYALAFGSWCQRNPEKWPHCVVVGRDARVSGEICSQIVTATLRSLGINVVDAGFAPTPTVAMGVLFERAQGGVVLSASHNPENWNALKLLNEKSEFLSPEEGRHIMALAQRGEAPLNEAAVIGTYEKKDFIDPHIESILSLPFCNPKEVAKREYTVVVDGINSVGAIALPRLLERLGVRNVHVLNGEVNGRFAHPLNRFLNT